MSKIHYEDHKLSRKSQAKLDYANGIIENYQAQGYNLTLRQLYYQLVSRDMIPNKQTEYANLGDLVKKARMSGQLDWDAIIDRNRVPRLPYNVNSPEEALNDAYNFYRRDRQSKQDVYIEVWLEKDALSEVLYRKTNEYHVRLMVNRGFSSTTAMHEAFKRFRNAHKYHNQRCVILYVGDHDPSGLFMLKDIEDRLTTFGANYVEVHPVALTWAQIQEHKPPPNPTKTTDPRAKWYVKRFGDTSWEVDALPPDVLNSTVDKHIKDLIDFNKYEGMLLEESIEKNMLKKVENIGVDNILQTHENLEELRKSVKDDKKFIKLLKEHNLM